MKKKYTHYTKKFLQKYESDNNQHERIKEIISMKPRLVRECKKFRNMMIMARRYKKHEKTYVLPFGINNMYPEIGLR